MASIGRKLVRPSVRPSVVLLAWLGIPYSWLGRADAWLDGPEAWLAEAKAWLGGPEVWLARP